MLGGRRGRLIPLLLAVVVILAFFAPLLSSRISLANRDVAVFHLPLRVDLVRLAADGLPGWNPWLHGGQPVLSNPNYAVFYPPTWLAFLVGPLYSLNLLVLLHVGLAFVGAWRLVRRLGCGFGAAGLAAVGFSAGGGLISLLSSFNFFCGMAWFPWAVGAAAVALARPAGERWLLSALACGGFVGLQLLAGEPVSVLITGLVLLGMALVSWRRPGVAGRLAVALVFAAAFAAVQLVPAGRRLADSPRSAPLPLPVATAWSAPPARLVELIFPYFWGDPTRIEDGLYLGWHLYDKGYPYVASIYPGLLIALLGLAALAARPIPLRGAWVFASCAGLLLALGRYNPAYPWLHDHLPVLGVLRYPEKFLLAPLACLPIAAALGWQRLVDERRRGGRSEPDLPLGLSLGVLACAVGLGVLTMVRPAAEGFFRVGSFPPPGPETVGRGVAFLRQSAAVAVVTTAAAAALLALWRGRRLSPAVLSVCAWVLLLADLWGVGHRTPRFVPASLFEEPPPLAKELAPQGHRVFTGIASSRSPELVARTGDAERQRIVNGLARLHPYSGNLWGISYALHEDFDLMLTAPARKSLEILRNDWRDRAKVVRFLGAWNVGTLVMTPSYEQQLASWKEGVRSQRVESAANPFVLPRFRFVPEVELHRDAEAALAAAREQNYELGRLDHWVDPERVGEAPLRRGPMRRPRKLEVEEHGDAVEARVQLDGPGLFVAAMTWDRGWRARVDGEAVPTYLTAVGQIGIEVPPGEHRLVLEYRDPWVGVGAAVTGSALLFALLAVRRPRRRREALRTATIPPEA